MTAVIWDRPDDDLGILFDRAVAHGVRCHFCGGPLSLPCIYSSYLEGAKTFLHPACAAEFGVFILAAVQSFLCGLNAHLGIQKPQRIGKPSHPEAC